MLARMSSLRSLTHRVAAIALAAAIAMPATAQSSAGTQTDGRWQAWLGCWTPAGTLVRVVGKSSQSVVCVLPAASASAVDLMTVSGGKIIDSSHVDADGQPHAISREGCTGWQTAKWSPSARRVYLKSEFNCKGAAATHVSAVYAMAGSGEWIDVQGMRVDKNSGVHTVRYREADDDTSLPASITTRLHERSMARMAAMLAVTEPPSLGDVEEASRELDPSVVATWLIEADKVSIQKPAPLNAKELVQLADNGVPSSVIDVMVGLSYPDVLTVNPTNRGVARQNTDSAYSQYGYMNSMAAVNPIIGFDRFGFPIYASESTLLEGCSPWLYGPYDAGLNLYASRFGCGYAGYGYAGYGYGAYPSYGYYGGYFGGGPIVVPRGPGSGGSAPQHGHVVNGRGYTRGGNGSGETATPRSNTSGASSSGGGSTASAPPPPPPRTAVPKKP
ncbi:MAG: hypothetical protein ACHQSE_14840 [Gemmatimonadales bacterium]